MSKPWQLSKWRKRRAEFIEGKSCEWCGSHEGPLIIHHPQEKNTLSDEKYESFDGALVLCKRCHFALHKEMHLCPNCKKKYVPNKFDVCFDCLPSERKEAIKSRREEQMKLMTEISEEETYETRLEYCGNCDFHVEIDQELFCGLAPKELCDHGLWVENGVRRFKSNGKSH